MPGAGQTGNDDLLADDNFHATETDEWWEHETIWFWWFNPERRLGAWHYHYLRPNIGVAGGGLFVFDESSWFHMEAPYYFNYSNTPMPDDPDFRDVTFPSGERFQMLDPLQHYLTYGWKEGRDPSAQFSTNQYLAAYGDVAAAGINPLQHYLEYGAVEGRSTFGDGTFA